MSKTKIKDFGGGLNLQESSTLDDNQFEELLNMFYDSDWRLQSRRGIKLFWNPIPWNKPPTSWFHYINPTSWLKTTLVSSWTDIYSYDEWTSNWSSIKTGLTEFEVDWVTRTRWSFTVYLSKIYLCNWIDSYAEYDPATTTYTALWTQPKVRYLAYLWDAIYWAWDDSNPSLLYATDAAALDWRTLNANDVLVWWEEDWRINWLEELQKESLVFKNKKVYSVPWDLTSALPLDAENGWYWDKAIERVWNSLVYFNDRGFNTLKAKSAASWVSAIQDEPLSDDLKAITSLCKSKQYNHTIWKYILPLTNYYGMFDSSWDDKPDTTIVYSSLKRAWSQYNYPALYDFGEYKDDDGIIHYVWLSATSWQVFEIETWLDDLWIEIDYKIASKKYDLWDSTEWKTHTAVDLVWLKSLWDDIDISILVDWVVVSWSIITDDYLSDTVSEVLPIWTQSIWTWTIWWWAITDEWIKLYKYKIRVPLLESGSNIQFILTASSKSLIFTLDRANLHHDWEDTDLFEFDNIW